MKRTNTFKLDPSPQEEEYLFKLADNCAKLWNELNYKRRQSFFNGEIDWKSSSLYNEFKGLVGSATAQQVIRKNDEAWRSFLDLLKQKKDDELPPHVNRVSPPGYWKDTQGNRELRILIRNDCYELDKHYLKIPFGHEIRWKGDNKWSGKQGRLEIKHDPMNEAWYAYQPVEVESEHQAKGKKKAYVDIGVNCPLMALVDDEVFGYRANSMLADWWNLTHEIGEHQAELKLKNGKRSSRELKRLYQERRRRFKDFFNKLVHDFVVECWEMGVNEIVCGDLNGIRDNVNYNRKANSMIHNYWSHRYVLERLEWTAENYGIRVKAVDERGTSSKCPRCNSEEVTKRGRLFKCKNCGLEAHRDAVGCVNIGLAHGLNVRAGVVNWAVARPSYRSLSDA